MQTPQTCFTLNAMYAFLFTAWRGRPEMLDLMPIQTRWDMRLNSHHPLDLNRDGTHIASDVKWATQGALLLRIRVGHT